MSGKVGINNSNPIAPLQIGSDFVFFNNSQEYLIGRNIKEDNGNWTKKLSSGSAASLSFTNTGDLKLNAYTSLRISIILCGYYFECK